MDRRQKIMRLIIEMLGEKELLRYVCNGAVTVSDPTLIILEFTAITALVRGDFSIRGVVGGPLDLKVEYDTRSSLNDHPDIFRQIGADLKTVSAKINQLI
jgi:hypothetical protein